MRLQEARFYLRECGLSRLDGGSDGALASRSDRREGAVLGVVYTVLITALFVIVPATPGPTMGFPMFFLGACLVLLFDFWRRVFKKP